MKKILSFILIACFSTALFGQTIVSTTPSNKNVILEEYTGTNCSWCPDGHKVANQIMVNNPGRAWAINIHQGGFSGNNPDYKTEWGNALANQYGINSYPNATVNRGASASSTRSQWTVWANAILAEPSPVNVAATATINWETRELTVLVEVYYTGNAAQTTNLLNVALLQDNILGPQVGANLYPQMIRFGNLYQHNHMLRHLLTGQWGVTIPATTTGTFFTQTFTYTIPEHLRNVPYFLEDLEVIAFVCEDHKTILSGCQAEMRLENTPALLGRVNKLEGRLVETCDGANSAICYIRNSNEVAINSVNLSYTVDNITKTYTWNKRTIAPSAWDTIYLPAFLLQPNQNATVTASLSKINGIDVTATPISATCKKEIVEGDATKMTLVIKTDQYASETSCRIYNPDGTVLFEKLNGFTNNTEHRFDFIPVMTGCHRVEVYDSYGDGISPGYVRILNSSDVMIYSNNGGFGSKLSVSVSVGYVDPPVLHTVTASAGANGTISSSGAVSYLHGVPATYVFTPNNGYEVEDVFIDNAPMSMAQAAQYIFQNIDKDYTIYVTFKLIAGVTRYMITATAGENGTITPAGATEYDAGETPTYTFTPNAGYKVEEVFINNVPMNIEGATEYTFPALDQDYTIHVTFKLIAVRYTITATAGANGTIMPAGATEYDADATPTYTFTPNEGYQVEDVLINGVSMDMEGATEYTFPALDNDYTIHVTFKLIDGIKDINGVVISVAPNPMNAELFVKGTYEKLEIFSVSGQIVTTAYNQPIVDVSHLAKGIYVVKILSDGKTCSFKIIK